MNSPGDLRVGHNLHKVNIHKYLLKIFFQTTNYQASQYSAWFGYASIGSQNPKCEINDYRVSGSGKRGGGSIGHVVNMH